MSLGAGVVGGGGAFLCGVGSRRGGGNVRRGIGAAEPTLGTPGNPVGTSGNSPTPSTPGSLGAPGTLMCELGAGSSVVSELS